MGDSAKNLEEQNGLQSQEIDKTFDELEDSFNREFSSNKDMKSNKGLQAELDEFDDLVDVNERRSNTDENSESISEHTNSNEHNGELEQSNEAQLELDGLDLEPEVLESSQHIARADTSSTVNTKASWPMRLTVATALLGVIGVAGYGYLNQEQFNEQLLNLSTSTTTLTIDANVSAEQLASLDQIMESITSTHQNLVNEAQLTSKRVNDIGLQLGSLTQTVNSNTEALVSTQQDLLNLGVKITELDDRFDTTYSSLNGKVNAIEKRVTPARNNAAPVFNVANNIEGATLESVDKWNNVSFVNLRDAKGKWVSLQTDQSYKGWVVKSIADGKVVFNRGGRTGQNKVLSAIQ